MKKNRLLLITAILLTLFLGACSEAFDWDPNNYEIVVLNNTNAIYHFKTGQLYSFQNMPDDIDKNGIINEPWCTELPALCGNYLITDESNFNAFSTVPFGEFTQYCEEMPLNKVIVFQLADESYALVKIVNDLNTSSNDACEHSITLHINYPAFTGLNNRDSDENTFAEDSYINTNPGDPEFMRMQTDVGDVINVFGDRDVNGLPENAKQINITTAMGETNELFFNDDGLLSSVVADNGTVFNYTWLENNELALDIQCNNGINQFNMLINLDDVDNGNVANSIVSFESNEVCSEINFHPFTESENRLKSAPLNGVAHELRVLKCNQPFSTDNPRVTLLNQSGSKQLKTLTANYKGTGVFQIQVPDGSAPEIKAQLIVDKLGYVLGQYCTYAGDFMKLLSPVMCSSIAAELALSGVGTVVAPTVGSACFGITKALDIYCNVIKIDTGIDGTDSKMDIFLKKMKENKYWNYFDSKDEYMKIKVEFPSLVAGSAKHPDEMTYMFDIADGAGSTLYADFGDAFPEIKNMGVYPYKPLSSQGYKVTASMFCLPVGSTVTFSAIGTDGWMDEKDYQISDESQSSGNFEMYIDARGNRDTDVISVSVSTPWAGDISKELSVSIENQELIQQQFEPYKSYSLLLIPNGDGFEMANWTDGTKCYLDWKSGSNEFSHSYTSFADGTVNIDLKGHISYDNSGNPLLTAIYSVSSSYEGDYIKYNINVTNLPAKSVEPDKSIFEISNQNNLNISSYVSYNIDINLWGETYKNSSFDESAEFTFEFKND